MECMNVAEWVYTTTEWVFDGSSVLLKLGWVLLVAVVLLMFFVVTLSAIGFSTWLWYLSVGGVVVCVGVLLVSVLVFGS